MFFIYSICCNINYLWSFIFKKNKKFKLGETTLKNISTLLPKFVVFMVFVFPAIGFCCEACRGNPNSPLTAGMDMAILTLLGIIGFVLSGFISFFLYLRKKALSLQKI